MTSNVVIVWNERRFIGTQIPPSFFGTRSETILTLKRSAYIDVFVKKINAKDFSSERSVRKILHNSPSCNLQQFGVELQLYTLAVTSDLPRRSQMKSHRIVCTSFGLAVGASSYMYWPKLWVRTGA